MAGKMSVHEEILAAFVQSGGILLKKDNNSAGEPVILHKKQDADWHERLSFTNPEFRDRTFNYLLKKQSKFFRRG